MEWGKWRFTQKKCAESHGPYCQAMKAGNFVFSTQVGLDKAGNMVSDDAYEQTVQILKNFEVLLQEVGGTLDSIVKCTVYLSDWNDFDKMNKAYKEMMKKPFPARCTVKIAAMVEEAKVEMEIIAYID